jgi:hypothetical protein
MMVTFAQKLAVALAESIRVEPSQGDGWRITTKYGYIDYRHVSDGPLNEIWWVESHKKGHGLELVDLMQRQHPAGTIAWGVTSKSGDGLMRRWHSLHPEVECATGAHDGQFDPFGGDMDDDDDDLDCD